MAKINEKTTIPLWSVFAAVPVFVCVVFWAASVGSTSEATARRVDRIEDAVLKMREDVSYLRAREEIREKQNKAKGG